MILQMDIEGAEYDVLTFESTATLGRFSTMIIEFHGLEQFFDWRFLHTTSIIFEKLYRNFSICHVHPNNCCGVTSLNGIDIPNVIEVSFLRHDLVDQFKSAATHHCRTGWTGRISPIMTTSICLPYGINHSDR